MEAPGTTLVGLLELDAVALRLCVAGSIADGEAPKPEGRVVAQALPASGLTVPPGRVPRSLDAWFVRGRDDRGATELHVDSDRDGRSFSARRVTAARASGSSAARGI